MSVLRELHWVHAEKAIEKTASWGRGCVSTLVTRASVRNPSVHSTLLELACNGYVIPTTQVDYMVTLVLFGLGLVQRHKEGMTTIYVLDGESETFTV